MKAMFGGKCPNCEKLISRAKVENLDIAGVGTTYHGISIVCPFCNTILGASIDPIAIKTDIIQGLLQALRK